MTVATAVRVWPPVGVAAMLLLGWAVRAGPTGLDQWFQGFRRGPARWLLLLTDPYLLLLLLVVAVAVAASKRWWSLVAAAIVAPPVAYVCVQLTKRLIGRMKGDGLAYPSGHTTVMVVVLGLLVIALGASVWVVTACVVYAVLGAVGQGVTYHYITDAIGAVLFGTAIVCVVALVVKRTAPGLT